MSNKKFLELVPLDPRDTTESPVLKKTLMALDFKNPAPEVLSTGVMTLDIEADVFHKESSASHSFALGAVLPTMEGNPPAGQIFTVDSATQWPSTTTAPHVGMQQLTGDVLRSKHLVTSDESPKPKVKVKLPRGTKTIVGTKGPITIPTVVKKPGNTFKRR